MSYRDAGVDLDAGNTLIKRIKPHVKRTMRAGVLGEIGGFGALFELSNKYQSPVLVSGTDGVGTKLKLAFQLNQHSTIGIDLVAMSVNDILAQGAEPLFFLDYFACGKLDITIATMVIEGIASGCEQAGCALIGGETAEMPDMYPPGEYDLAGFAVGVVEKKDIITGASICEGDKIIGLASSGAHSNGYSLIRKIIKAKQCDLSTYLDGKTLADTLMTPTRIYVKPLQSLIQKLPIKGIAHITGGGLLENLPRILPKHLAARLQKDSWHVPALFGWLQQQGNITDDEMQRVFNCGIGMVLVVAPKQVSSAIKILQNAGETAWQIGEVKLRQAGEMPTVITR